MTRTILLVDDHAGFRRSARALLDAEGFEVIGESGTASDALAKAQSLRPELVLLDIQLPDRDGFDVAELLAAEVDPPAVILISTREAREYGGRVEKTPARGFISKPLLSGAAIRAILG
jgi:DNA-binding NarL/FixJ family response regulator